jgi:hypothetical protein
VLLSDVKAMAKAIDGAFRSLDRLPMIEFLRFIVPRERSWSDRESL